MKALTTALALLLLAGCSDTQPVKPAANRDGTTANSVKPAPAKAGGTSDAPADAATDTATTIMDKDSTLTDKTLNQDSKLPTPNSKSTLTPLDQNENQKDLDITANIRKRVVDAKDMSVAAHNVTIITRGGNVTLKGSVKTDAEKQEIERIAHDAAGAGSVDSQLEVK